MWPRPETMTRTLVVSVSAALWCSVWCAIFAAGIRGSESLTLATVALLAAIAGGFAIPTAWMSLTVGALGVGAAIGAAAGGVPWVAVPAAAVGVICVVIWLFRVVPRIWLYRQGTRVRGTVVESDGDRAEAIESTHATVHYRIEYRDAEGRTHQLTGRDEFPLGARPLVGDAAEVYYAEAKPERAVAVFGTTPRD
ncbi:DUF3592 domain-containing protein [Gordonia sihwensis]|uniref:DUF3592 domain-containing protein n=1 Tax=Gordonia TaxID=2053 RepID=UPI00241799F7|nr:DUF3592 domain-containing protein [Gordonia sihwensis]WFN92658.1 DUF3592 domain-containing protein [Gordonia sihwensis]